MNPNMSTKLAQKHLLKGSREFELVDDYVEVRMKPRFGETEQLRVMLTVLDPEPVVSESLLCFNSRVNGEPLISLFLGKPSTDEFNAFVSILKQRARDEYNAFAGLRPGAQRTTAQFPGPGGNVFDEPPDFGDSDDGQVNRIRRDLDPERIKEAVQMLRQHMDEQEIDTLISALEALVNNPSDEALLGQALDAFNGLGPMQGAVLTYAPYVSIVLSDDPLNW
jgi:hypothetical protein